LQLALRPYVTAGIALVGAGVIAATPVLAPAPEIQSRIEYHAVELTAAVDNPIDVFRPVVHKVGDLVRGAIQAELDNPFPIINGVIGRAVIDVRALAEIGNSMGQIITTLANKFPGALAIAGQKAFNGDFTGAVQAFTPVFIGPFFQTFMQFISLKTFVQDRFVLAGQLAAEVMMTGWSLVPGQALGLFSIVNAVAGALDELWKAVPSGDLGQIVNALQHGAANVSIATLGLVDGWRTALDYQRTRFRDILNPPPPVPEEPIAPEGIASVATPALPATTASLTPPAIEASTPATEEVVAPGFSTPTEMVLAPVEAPETEVVETAVETPATEVVVATPAATPETEVVATPEIIDETDATTLIRLSPQAVPGPTGTTAETSKRDALRVRDAVKSRLTKVAAGLGGGHRTGETSTGSTQSSSESGNDNTAGE
jgi:hypothetical protein